MIQLRNARGLTSGVVVGRGSEGFGMPSRNGVCGELGSFVVMYL